MHCHCNAGQVRVGFIMYGAILNQYCIEYYSL